MPDRSAPSIRYCERLAEIGAIPSIGTVGDGYDKRPGRNRERLLQGRADPRTRAPQPVEDRRRGRARHARLGASGTIPSACAATSATCRPPSSSSSTPLAWRSIAATNRSRSQLTRPQDASHSLPRTRSRARSRLSRWSRPRRRPLPPCTLALRGAEHAARDRAWLTDNNINTSNLTLPARTIKRWPNHKTPEPPSDPGRFSTAIASFASDDRRRRSVWRHLDHAGCRVVAVVA